jgi:hypothetical protein
VLSLPFTGRMPNTGKTRIMKSRLLNKLWKRTT